MNTLEHFQILTLSCPKSQKNIEICDIVYYNIEVKNIEFALSSVYIIYSKGDVKCLALQTSHASTKTFVTELVVSHPAGDTDLNDRFLDLGSRAKWSPYTSSSWHQLLPLYSHPSLRIPLPTPRHSAKHL